MKRREFLKSIAATTIASLATTQISAQNSSAKLKVVIFWQEGFPTFDGLNLTRNILQNALGNHELIFAGESDLKTKLAEEIDVFVNPYGSAFPKKSWTAILDYLIKGGNFVNLGGTPFAVPIQNLKAETRTVSYHKRLGITQSFPIDGKDVVTWEENDSKRPKPQNQRPFQAEEIYEFYLKLSNVNDFPEDSGSDGRREANVEALFFGLDKDKLRIAAPVILIDRIQGEFAGGCWMLANFKGKIEPSLIKELIERASFSAFEVVAKTDYATYKRKDVVTLDINFLQPLTTKKRIYEIGALSYSLERPNKSMFFLNGRAAMKKIESTNVFSLKVDGIFEDFDGFYKLKITTAVRSSKGLIVNLTVNTGFWVLDEKLLGTGAPFTADRHFLYRNNQPFPVVGTTYMSSTVARRFLIEPNPAVWDRDFAEMRAAGVNMIRTGIWTGWKLYFDEKGDVREEILRAFEAFILTAKKYDIAVMFTFFAFMPEFFGGKNAYLDTVSIAGQKKFLSAFASRVKSAKDVMWDLINEPSFANPKNLWSCRPSYDEFEKRAWLEFLKKRHNEQDEAKLADILRDKWRLRDDENPFELPAMQDFDNVNILVKRRPLKTLEFRLFAQEIFKQWAQEMSATLKKAGNPAQLVTVGQDEAGTGDSPAQQFHSDVLDLTGLHNWWANDDLLWDAVVTKAPEKPNLVQETGLMFYEKQDGAAWRTDENAVRLLERKMAISLAANGAGFIEWIWNINPFMDNENEAAIGFHRFDGTAKKELKSFIKIARFANENRRLFAGKKDEKILLVIPHSYQFLPRNYAQEATKKAVRVLHYHCLQTARAVSEYNLQAILKEPTPPKLIIVPSVNSFNQAAWENLLKLVEKGATVAISGYFDDDEYLIPQNRLEDLGSNEIFPPVPVSPNEFFEGYYTHFGGEKIQQVRKANAGKNGKMQNISDKGKNILWSPVPLEIGDNLQAIKKFYDTALAKVGLMPEFELNDYSDGSVLVRPTEFENAFLYLVINESSEKRDLQIRHLKTDTKIDLPLEAEQTQMFFIDKSNGKILAKTD